MDSKNKKTILITGSFSGLGKELSNAYLEGGHRLILCDIFPAIRYHAKFNSNKNVIIINGDITKPNTIAKLEKTISKINEIDILINNAGIIYIQPFDKNTDSQFQRVLGVNLIAPIKLIKKIYPFMQEQKRGHIINILSTAARYGKSDHTMYCASKFGLAGFTQSLRQEAKKYNIKITAIYPGGMKTDLYKGLNEKIDTLKFMDPKDVANAIVKISEFDGLLPEEIVLNNF